MSTRTKTTKKSPLAADKRALSLLSKPPRTVGSNGVDETANKKRKLDSETRPTEEVKRPKKSLERTTDLKEAGKKDPKASIKAKTKKANLPTSAVAVKATPPTMMKSASHLASSALSTSTKSSGLRAPKVAPDPEAYTSGDEEDDGHGEEEEKEDSDDEQLHGLSSGSDSSDEDDGDGDVPPVDLGKLPTIAKDDETVRRKLDRAKKIQTEERGVLYLGRIPHGFYEDQMKGYFSQFGNVTRIRLSRNKKTGNSKHYGFIEFDSLPVAEIVADTMNNYLLLGHILQCHIIPSEKVHPELWVGANRKWRKVPLQRVTRLSHNKERTEEQKERSNQRLLKRQDEKKLKLQAAGFDYNMDTGGFKGQP